MRNRTSHCSLKRGEWSLDHRAPLKTPELHYMLAADWGSVTVRTGPKGIGWFPMFRHEPDWDRIEAWLREVEKGMATGYGIGASSFVERALFQMQTAWKPTE